MVGAAPSDSYSDINDHTEKCKKRYVDFPGDILKLTCLINGNGIQ